ncbi:acyltransferase [Rhodococcus sp. BP-332]|uniref:acyltransferase n=1 Tax=Rhodococcus sp. BP-332 TaxID=2739447 RepID=UPI0021BE528F|nr:acyltransferase [Rhodococcus sp. BP-332]
MAAPVSTDDSRKQWVSRVQTGAREQAGERLYNLVITRIPSRTLRVSWLRLFGATIGEGTTIRMGTRVLGLRSLVIGAHCAIGAGCLLDARGQVTIHDDVEIDTHVQMISGQHVVDSDDFGTTYCPIVIGHHAWIASRSMVVVGVRVGAGAVVGAASLVRDDVAPRTVVAGVPARPIGTRDAALDYHPVGSPRLT